MSFAQELKTKISKYDLLTHPLYSLWNEGNLSKDVLSIYAKEYYHHVENFPKSLSSILSLCDSKEDAEIIQENLDEEINSTPSHPQLWLNFALSLGADE